jgi:hypothetical protein
VRELARTRQKHSLGPTSKLHAVVKFGVAQRPRSARAVVIRAARSIQARDNAALGA